MCSSDLKDEEFDRRLRVIEAPGYGIVGKSVTLRVAVEDRGLNRRHANATLTVRRDGEPLRSENAPVGAEQRIERPGVRSIARPSTVIRRANAPSAIAPVRLVNTDGAAMQPADLTAKSAALALALDRLTPRSDSFTVFVQGNAFGFQRSRLERAGNGWKSTEDTRLGPVMQQHTEVSFDAAATMQQVVQTGKVQGIDTRIEVTYAGGRAKGSAATPQPPGAPSPPGSFPIHATRIESSVMSCTAELSVTSPSSYATIRLGSCRHSVTSAGIARSLSRERPMATDSLSG